MLEAFEQTHVASRKEPAMESVAERMDVKQRESEQETIGGGDSPASVEIAGVDGEIVVREDCTLGNAGCSRRVDKRRRRLASKRCARELGGLAFSFSQKVGQLFG